MPDLKFNLDEFDRAVSGYRDTAKNISELKDTLTKHIDDLKSIYWQSKGGDAFMKKYNDGWVHVVDKYIAVLGEFAQMIQQARNEYAEVEEQARQIRF